MSVQLQRRRSVAQRNDGITSIVVQIWSTPVCYTDISIRTVTGVDVYHWLSYIGHPTNAQSYSYTADNQ